MVCVNDIHGGSVPSRRRCCLQYPESKVVLDVPLTTKSAMAPTMSRMRTPTLTAKMIQPVLAFLREPTGSAVLEVSAMMPKMRLGMPTKKTVLSIDTPDTMVRMIADVLLGTAGAPAA